MPNEGTILVTGASGRVGRNVVAELLAAGRPVRAAVRDPDSARLPDGVDAVRADLAEPASLTAALSGVDAVFLLWPFLTADAAPPVIDAIAGSVRRVVYLSSMGVRDDLERQADAINQFHADLERLIEPTGLERTYLRPAGFATNTLAWAAEIRASGVVRAPFAAMTRPLIHERDIAAVAAVVLVYDGYDRTKPLLSGPEALTSVEQLRLIGEAIGRQLRFEEISPDQAREQMLADGWPPDAADDMLRINAEMAEQQVEPVTSSVEEITGRPARSYRQWALDHAADFR